MGLTGGLAEPVTPILTFPHQGGRENSAATALSAVCYYAGLG